MIPIISSTREGPMSSSNFQSSEISEFSVLPRAGDDNLTGLDAPSKHGEGSLCDVCDTLDSTRFGFGGPSVTLCSVSFEEEGDSGGDSILETCS